MNADHLQNVLGLLESHLLDLKAQGVTEVEANPENVKALGRISVVPAPVALVETRRPPALSFRAAPQSMDDVVVGLKDVAARVSVCTKCRLCKTRKNTVPGQGSAQPDIMFIGEGPGADEDEQGLAFVGRAGQLLTKIIEAMGFTRDEVFIGNIVKCRPPDNRVPLPDEMQSCLPYLHEQIALLKPKVIVALGATAVKGLFGDDIGGITKIRGKWLQYQGIDAMPTYHPAYLLRNPPAKPDVWTDMKTVLSKLGREAPAKKS